MDQYAASFAFPASRVPRPTSHMHASQIPMGALTVLTIQPRGNMMQRPYMDGHHERA